MTAAPTSPPAPESRLESWKAIAAYLNRDERTVRRWEGTEGLPVHRHKHQARSSVYAYASELEAWRSNRKPGSSNEASRSFRIWGRTLAFAGCLVATMVSGGGGRVNGSATLQSTGGPADQVVWTMPSSQVSYGKVSPDGRYVPFTKFPGSGVKDREPGETGSNLYIQNLATGRPRRLTQGLANADAALAVAFSRDSRQLAFDWVNSEGRHSLRLVSLADSGVPRPRILADLADVDYIVPGDWSPDGRWIAAQIRRRDRTNQLVMFSTVDGSLKVLRSEPWRGDSATVLSPDGRYLAYDISGEQTRARDIFVLAVDGSRQSAAVTFAGDDALVGWSPGGLVFLSEVGGTPGLWSVPIKDGAPDGRPDQLRSSLPVGRLPIGMTLSGTIYFAKFGGRGSNLEVAAVDFDRGEVIRPPQEVVGEFLGRNGNPSWSPDGSALAFTSGRPTLSATPRDVIIVQEAASGRRRVVPSPFVTHGGGLAWSPDGRALLIKGRAIDDRQGWFAVDVESGAAKPIVLDIPAESHDRAQWSADGARVYFERRRGESGPFTSDHELVERDLVTTQERVLFTGTQNDRYPRVTKGDAKILFIRYPGPGNTGSGASNHILVERDLATGRERELTRLAAPFSLTFSPDGSSIAIFGKDPAVFSKNPSALTSLLGVIPTAGGTLRVIQRGGDCLLSVVAWSPDGRSLLSSCAASPTSEPDVFWVTVDGRVVKPLPSLKGLRFSSVHPGTGRVAFERQMAVSKPHEVHALTNAVPMSSEKK